MVLLKNEHIMTFKNIPLALSLWHLTYIRKQTRKQHMSMHRLKTAEQIRAFDIFPFLTFRPRRQQTRHHQNTDVLFHCTHLRHSLVH